jgi:outer membrane autotransporter protein
MSKRIFTAIPLPLGLGLCLMSGLWLPLAAQESTTRGLNLSFHIQATTLSVEGADSDGGGGAGIRVGYGFNRIVTAFFQLDGSSVDTKNAPDLSGEWTVAHADLGVRFHFANSLRSWVPYLEAAVGARAVHANDAQVTPQIVEDVSFNGTSFSVGGGLAVYLKETLALDVGVLLSSGEFNEIAVGAVSVGNLDIDSKSSRFSVGLEWWP